ncbi:MAG TPA: ornithine carbamoyltransferase [Rubrivivax sp.]|nr:ornithine carbamoyltransferase [Rubrivivax sp.]HPO18858.1 ornithine carbamoyltransferase [Rubrivivax sp.]
MVHTHHSTLVPAFGPHAPPDHAALLAQARTLQRDADAARVQPLLRGKNLGLLCADASAGRALLFLQAASELGAHVAHIGMSLSERSSALEVAHTARLLGRLYDAVECHGLPASLVQRLAGAAGITVYDALGSNEPLLCWLAAQLGSQAELPRNRRFALQALLLYAVE